MVRLFFPLICILTTCLVLFHVKSPSLKVFWPLPLPVTRRISPVLLFVSCLPLSSPYF